MIERKIKIGNKMIAMKCSGALPRIYGTLFSREIFIDIGYIAEASKALAMKPKNQEEIEYQMSYLYSPKSRNIAENIAYAMAYHADNSIPEFEEWLESLPANGISEATGKIFEIWSDCNKTTSTPKKAQRQ